MARAIKLNVGGTESDRHFVTALARGLEILACFSPTRTELGSTELAGLTGLPQPTVWRLCHTLVKLGFLIQTSGDKLRPGIPTLRLGYSALAALDFTELVRPHMRALADDFHAASSLAVYDAGSMLFIQRAESESRLLMNLRVGSRIAVVSSALGWAYLAALPQDEREAMITQHLSQLQDWKRVEPHLRKALDAYRRDGYITNTGNFHRDYNTAAVVIHDATGRPRYTLSVGGASSNVTPALIRSTIGPRLVKLANALEATDAT